MKAKRRNYVLIWAGGTAASLALERALASVLTPVEAPRPFADELEEALKARMRARTRSPWRSLGIVGGIATVLAGATAFVLWLTRRHGEAVSTA